MQENRESTAAGARLYTPGRRCVLLAQLLNVVPTFIRLSYVSFYVVAYDRRANDLFADSNTLWRLNDCTLNRLVPTHVMSLSQKS